MEAKEEMDAVFGPDYGWEPRGHEGGVHRVGGRFEMEDGTKVDLVDTGEGRTRGWNYEGDEPEAHQIYTPGRRSPRGSLSPIPTSPAASPGPGRRSRSQSPPCSSEHFSPMEEGAGEKRNRGEGAGSADRRNRDAELRELRGRQLVEVDGKRRKGRGRSH